MTLSKVVRSLNQNHLVDNFQRPLRRSFFYPYYTKKYREFWNECMKRGQNALNKDASMTNKKNNTYVRYLANEIYTRSAKPKHIAGYYITYWPKDALNQWLMSGNTNKTVDKILTELYLPKKPT